MLAGSIRKLRNARDRWGGGGGAHVATHTLLLRYVTPKTSSFRVTPEWEWNSLKRGGAHQKFALFLVKCADAPLAVPLRELHINERRANSSKNLS